MIFCEKAIFSWTGVFCYIDGIIVCRSFIYAFWIIQSLGKIKPKLDLFLASLKPTMTSVNLQSNVGKVGINITSKFFNVLVSYLLS